MRVILAPMQGVLDPFVRQLLTEVNDYDLCITEFVRVVDQLLPEKVFYRLCPELKNQGFTSSGTPVRVQLLGQNPECLGMRFKKSCKNMRMLKMNMTVVFTMWHELNNGYVI